MYVCLCKGITEEDIRTQLRLHGKAITKSKDLCSKIGVGSDCGVCIKMAEQILSEIGGALKQESKDPN